MTRCGIVALAGRPNAGKSSLLNAILPTPLAMVSALPQATRLPTIGIHTQADCQMVFVDLPGILEPEYAMQLAMHQTIVRELARADLILHLHPANQAPAPDIRSLLPEGLWPSCPVMTVYTKADLVPSSQAQALESDSSLLVSSHTGLGLQRLLATIANQLPEGPFRYPEDDIGTQPLRFFVGEYLREAAFELLHDEVPYAFIAEVEEFRETPKPVYIRATLFVERDSQKGILIGQKGATLKAIGSHARRRLEELLGEKVFLETWVKVLPKWRRSPALLKRFGFPAPEEVTGP